MRPNLSYWEKKNFLADQNLVIVGGGLVGLSTAIQFAKMRPAASILIVERSAMPLGASTRNAGFACLGSPSELIADLEDMGLADTINLVRRRSQGIRRLRSLVGDQAMHFEPSGGYEVFTDRQSELYNSCMDQMDIFNEHCRSFLDADIFTAGTAQVPEHTWDFAHIIAAPLEGLIDPGAMMRELIKRATNLGVNFLQAEVRSLHQEGVGVNVETSLGAVRAQQIVVATNGFTKELLPDCSIQPARNVVLVTSPLKRTIQGAFHHQAGYYYFRHIDDRILIGGARHLYAKRESTSQFGISPDLKNHLIDFLKKHLVPVQPFTIEYEWSGIMGFGANKNPTIERVSPNILVAAGLGGMGIALGSELGHEACLELAKLI